MYAPSLKREDKRLLRTVTTLFFSAFSLILFLLATGYYTEQRRVADANNFSALTSATSDVGTISQKIALLLFGALGKPDEPLMSKLNESIRNELKRFHAAREIAQTTRENQSLTSNTLEVLSLLQSEGNSFQNTTETLQGAILAHRERREAASKFAEQAVRLLELSRDSARRISVDASHQAQEAEILVRRYYLLSGTTIFATGVVVLLGLLVRLRRELTLRRTVEHNLVQANQDLERFSSVVAHDLKAPLTTIALSATLIDISSQTRENAELVRTIGTETSRLREMVQALLHISHGEWSELDLKPLELSSIIETVTDSLQTQIEKSGATVDVVSDAEILGDRTLLHNVFQNLIENSIKYRRKQTPKIYIAAKVVEDQVYITYEDNCIGIDHAMRDRVFDPFVQSPKQKNKGGVGLGLSVVKKVVACHAGTIEIVDKEGPGTRFLMKFPRGAGVMLTESSVMTH